MSVLTITIIVDVPEHVSEQITRAGFSVCGHGGGLRVKVGNKLLPNKSASVSVVQKVDKPLDTPCGHEDDNHEERQTGP